MDVAATMRRLFGSCGWAARQDTSITEDAYEPWGGDVAQEARATYKNAKKRGVGQNRTHGLSDASKDKAEGGGRTPNGFNRRTGLANRCYKCDSEHHLAPK